MVESTLAPAANAGAWDDERPRGGDGEDGVRELTLLGLGIVGGGVAHACLATGSRWTVGRALVRDVHLPRAVPVSPELLTADPEFALAGAGPVIEVLGGEQPAADLIAAALERGRPVVTANKAAIAIHGPRLFALARERGVGLGIEACVGGGVPIVAALRHLAASQRLTGVGGIINGTTNALLGAIEAGQSYEEALAAAQAAGFAEPDPSADVEGHDPAAKLTILAALAFGVRLDPSAIPRRPLSDVGLADLRWAAAHGARMKYLARARHNADGSVTASVEPTALPASDPLAAPTGSGNAIQVQGELIGATTLTGPGAGPAPTAGALLGDAALAVRGLLPLDYPAPDAPFTPVLAPTGRYVVRLPAGGRPDMLPQATSWDHDGDALVGLVDDTTASNLGPAVRALGGSCFRWEA
ncbi:MAG: homoserine dehydrogenase [Thermomicrobiales bacterium]